MRKRFNVAERRAMASGRCEVRDGRTWYPVTIRSAWHVTTDTLGTECVVTLPETIGRGIWSGVGSPGMYAILRLTKQVVGFGPAALAKGDPRDRCGSGWRKTEHGPR